MKILLRNTNGMLTLLLGVVVFIFYAFFYANHLHFQEQLQLFSVYRALFYRVYLYSFRVYGILEIGRASCRERV